ncbi:MAG: hypothetical protein A2506_07825 [Elusimicrobia bacterium RIFOXYD12_FULL_66_9]|nr:MAG: hypothetical protein A2506_07825 [Elusimicrobia bacterium RIFOXYD12_FULL_66_9]
MRRVFSIEPEGILKAWSTNIISSEAMKAAEKTVSAHSRSSLMKCRRLSMLSPFEKALQKPNAPKTEPTARAG